MKNQLVSILIPLHNAEKYIAETIKSALDQTWTNKEIIIVDDHSTDRSLEIARQFESERLKVYVNNKKGGCAARNLAFQLSSGDFIQYLDADDLLSPDKIRAQMLAIEDKTDAIALCNTYHFYDTLDNSFTLDEEGIFSIQDPVNFLISLWGGGKYKPHYVAVHSYLTPRHLIEKAGEWNEDLTKDQDGEFFTRVILQSKSVHYVSGVRSYYRKYIGGSNVAAQTNKKSLDSIFLSYTLKEKYLFSFDQSDKAKLAMATQYKLLAIEAYPSYPELYKLALNKSKDLGGSNYLSEMGGKTIMIVAKVLGWRTAKRISILLHRKID